MSAMIDEARVAVARGWEKSGLSQAEYAAQHGISGRTLRSWRARYLPAGTPVEDARRVIARAIEKLRALLAGLESGVEDQGEEAACRAEGVVKVEVEPAGAPGDTAADTSCRAAEAVADTDVRPSTPDNSPPAPSGRTLRPVRPGCLFADWA
jgi:hypothetical protein